MSVDYAGFASSVNKSLTNFSSSFKTISNSKSDFNSIWSGDAHDSLIANLDGCVSAASSQKENVNKLISALNIADNYEKCKNVISDLKSTLNKYDKNNPNHASVISTLNSRIASEEKSLSDYKSKVKSTLSDITSYSAKYDVITYSKEDFVTEYVADIQQLMSLFSSNSLTKLTDSETLYNYISQTEVESYINNIKSLYSGRDASVNCALGIISLAASVGKKLDYDWGGGHSNVTSLAQVASGTDCSSFASWCVNQGSTGTFTTRATGGLVSCGKRVDYSQAQGGDILVYNSGGSGHAIFIVENHPETNSFVVAEARGSSIGVVLGTRTYKELSGTYQARDMSEYYS